MYYTRENIKPFFKNRIWLLPFMGILLILLTPFIIIFIFPIILRKEYWELITDMFDEILGCLILPFIKGD